MSDSPDNNEILLTRKEAAEILGVISSSVRNWARQGLLTDYDGFFKAEEVELLKIRIDRGEVDRLTRRANKTKARGKFIPSEYISTRNSTSGIRRVISFVLSENLAPEPSIFYLAFNLFIRNKNINIRETADLFSFCKDDYKRDSVREHLSAWYENLKDKIDRFPDEAVSYLLSCELPGEEDLLGIIYQSLIHEGKKSGAGSYYTPRDVVDNLLDGSSEAGGRFLDPCCGTGQFLLAMADRTDDPEMLFGFDLDESAVRIAGTNLLLKYPDHDFSPRIYHHDSLLNTDSWTEGFDFIATNPPWGAKYNREVLVKIRDSLPEAEAKDSFSWFILASHRMLKAGGKLCLVLPESITNVKDHRGIREFLCSEMVIDEIAALGKRFKKVMSPVITLKMTKSPPSDNRFPVRRDGARYEVDQKRFLSNRNFIFDIRIDDQDLKIIRKLYDRKHVTLKGRADWALGIVTGNNKRFVMSNPKTESPAGGRPEPIFRGSNILPFRLKDPVSFIEYKPELFQQTAPGELYRAKEKLFYRFISKRLVFALDEDGRLALNSTNILIPRIKDYPIKVILGFLNSKLFNFFFMKKFNSVKVLRGDLEQLPFPVLQEEEMKVMIEIVDGIMAGEYSTDVLDDYVYRFYSLQSEECLRIESVVASP